MHNFGNWALLFFGDMVTKDGRNICSATQRSNLPLTSCWLFHLLAPTLTRAQQSVTKKETATKYKANRLFNKENKSNCMWVSHVEIHMFTT